MQSLAPLDVLTTQPLISVFAYGDCMKVKIQLLTGGFTTRYLAADRVPSLIQFLTDNTTELPYTDHLFPHLIAS